MGEQCQRSHQMLLGNYPGPDGSPYPGPKTKRQLRKTSADSPRAAGKGPASVARSGTN